MIEPTYVLGNLARLYREDCLNVLAQMDAESVDMIVTSPPYNVRKDYKAFNDQMPWPDYYDWMGRVLDECYRVLRRGGTLAINVPGVIRWQADHQYSMTWAGFDPEYKTHRNGEKVLGKGRIEPLGFRLFDMMAVRDPHMREPVMWVKGSDGNAICSDYRMGCDSDPYLRSSHEWILLGSKGQWFHRGGTGRRGKDAVPFLDFTKDTWFIPPKGRRDHPAVFPVELPERLIKLFVHAPDAVICDPFLGSGSTGVAAVQLGYAFIGIEQDPGFTDLAASEIRAVLDAKAQISLFDDEPELQAA